MKPDFGRRWTYEMRDGGQALDARELGADDDAMEWASSRLRELGLREAAVVLVRDDGTERPVGTVRRAKAD